MLRFFSDTYDDLDTGSHVVPTSGLSPDADLLPFLDRNGHVEVPALLSGRSGSLRVLVVDDNLVVARVVGSLLKRLGHAVGTAEDGTHALERIRESAWDLVLMDIEMPVLDGLSATRQVRGAELRAGRDQHLPIVALTAFTGDADRRLARAAGMDGVLEKPVGIDGLKRMFAVLGASV